MELKGSNNWSDLDSEERDAGGAKEDAPKQRPVEAQPERRAPLFNLGVIYSRQPEFDSAFQKEVFQERERSAPEVAQGVALGVPEFGGVQAPEVLSPAEQAARAAQAAAPEAGPAYAEDDDDDQEDDTDKDKKTASVGRAPVVKPRTASLPPPAPLEQRTMGTPVSPLPDQRNSQPSAAVEQFNRIVHGDAELALPFDPREYQSPAKPPSAEDWIQPLPPPQPTEYVPPAGGGGNIPPVVPPERPAPQSPEPEPRGWGSEPNPQVVGYTYNALPPQPNTTQYVSRRQFETGMEDTRRKMAARMIVVALLGWYLGRRPVKPLREQVSHLETANKEQAEQLNRLTYQHQETQARIAEQNRQIEQFTQPQAATPFRSEQTAAYRPQPAEALVVPAEAQLKVVGENGEEVVLQPGQRLVREGAYSEVVDEHNRVIQNAIPHGKEYQRDLSRERMPSPFGAQDARFTPGSTGGGGGGAGQPMAGISGAPVLPSVPGSHMLPMNSAGQTPNQEAQHLLNAPKTSALIAAITSPWLWLGVGVLFIAFFAAATI